MKQFVHLHLHTQYSMLDGANKLQDIIGLAHSKGQPAIGMTDHGNMHGAIEFFIEAKRIGIKPILGCEFYVTPGSRFDKKAKGQEGSGINHITALASDMEGYKNLCRLSTLAYTEGFYYKPRVDHELLERYSKGVIAFSGCLAGELSDLVQSDDIEKARELCRYYATVFKDRFYLELQPHTLAEQRKLNLACTEIAKDLGLPLVLTNDVHYPTKEDHYAQEVLMCVSTGKQVSDPTRMRYDGMNLYLKSYEELSDDVKAYSAGQEAISNTVEIANRCNLDFNFKKHYFPKYSDDDSANLTAMMSRKAQEGLQIRLDVKAKKNGQLSQQQIQIYQDRLLEELKLIDTQGFAGYFLVVADFIVWAKENGVPVGPGRGSAAGSLVAYALRITDIDPIENKLLFERFLNPERVSLPDIDVDFCITGRDRVIQYVVQKYGAGNVAQIATFGTLKAKAAIKDVGRALGLSYAETDRIAELVPAPRQGFDFSLSESIKMEKRLKDYAEGEGRELISLALKLEGLTRHTSTHAAGVVIGDRPLIDMLPLMLDKEGKLVTQYSMSFVEKIGLVKFDFLGLKTLTVIHAAIKLIKESRGIDIDLQYLPLEDPKTYALLCSGNTTGVFQLESSGITEMTMRLKPSCFNDLVAILALYRPGPLDAGMVDHYIQRKHGREPVQYLHPIMKESLADTYGIIVYQEQIMQLARELAGYSLGQADLLRRAMGKKNPEEMAQQKDSFIKGAGGRGISQSLAITIFDQIETFARYGFNRSHSAAYAMISFQTAYLKAHFNVEFMAALMSLEMDDSDKTLKNLNECKKQGIQVLPPDANKSSAGFSVEDGKIRFGLEAVKGLGNKAAEAIITARSLSGAFLNLDDFATRVESEVLNRRVLEGLIKSGAFDFSGISRRAMFEDIENLQKFIQARFKPKETKQMGFFSGEVLATKRSSPGQAIKDIPEWPGNQRLSYERESLGFYISGHPLEKYEKGLKRLGALTTTQARQQRSASTAAVGGVVTALKLKNTKKGDRYATFTLEDWLGTIETIVWPRTYNEVGFLLTSDDPVLVRGKLDITEERAVLIVDKMESLIDLRNRTATHGVLELHENDYLDERMGGLMNILGKYNGACPLKIRLSVQGSEVSISLKDGREVPICVQPSEDLCNEVEQLFGRSVLTFG